MIEAARWQNATVVEIVERTPRIKSFFFTLPSPLTFVAGQHVDVRLTAPDGYRAMRSYSIASAPEARDQIELAIELLGDGEVSPFFHDEVRVGDTIELRGPLGGHFIWRESDGGPLLFLGGGSGVVPLVSMLRHRRAIKSAVAASLVLSGRTWDELLYRDELIEMAESDENLRLALTITREPPRRTGDYGRRIDAPLVREVLERMPAAPARVYICGTNQFVNAASEAVIAAGAGAADIRTERYGA